MDLTQLRRLYALSRIGLGVVALAAPGVVSKGFGIGTGPGAKLAGRYLGCRDLVMGVGMVLGERHGSARGWYEAAGAVDLGDTLITLAGTRRGLMPWPRAVLVSGLAMGSAAVGFVLAATSDENSAEPTLEIEPERPDPRTI